MRVRCPHCHYPIEVIDDSSLNDINCSTCGGNFSLIGGTEETETSRSDEKRIGHFVLTDRLGIGAFGTVWKAKDTKLDRFVAIKIPRKGQLSDTETEQFLREARAAAQLKHPNIVSVHEIGMDEESVYIVSDYVEGATLKDSLNGLPLPPREAANLTATIADALHHAHEQGVVHRDLKPGNIMLDLKGEPYVLDFGLAKRESGEMTMTVDGALVGTPAYMSPEQARGEGHNADRRSDVYSLGAVLFEVLTGELPFRGQKRMLIVKILTEEPARPRSLNSVIPRDLETICLKCLEKEPAKRYSTAEHLHRDLRLFLHVHPITSRPVSRIGRLWRWSRRNPSIARLTAALVVSVALSMALLAFFLVRSQDQVFRSDMRLAASALNDGNRSLFEEIMRDRAASIVRTNGFLLPYLRSRYEELQSMRVARESLSEVAIGSVSFAQELLAIGYIDGTIEILNLKNQDAVLDIRNDPLRGDIVRFSPNGNFLAALGKNLPLSILNVSDQRVTRDSSVKSDSFANDLVFIDDHRLACFSDGILQVFSVPELNALQGPLEIEADGLWRAHLCVSPNGQYLAVGLDKTASIFDTEQLETGRSLPPREDWINVLKFVSDSSLLVGGENGVDLMKIGDDFAFSKAAELDIPATCVSSENGVIAIGTSDFNVWICNLQLERVGRLLQTDFVNSITLTPAADRLFAGGRDNAVTVWPREYWNSQKSWRIAESVDPAVSISAMGKIATFHQTVGESYVRIWEPTTTVNEIVIPIDQSATIVGLAFAHQQEWLAGVTQTGTIIVWDSEDGTRLGSQEAHDWSHFKEPYVTAHSSIAISHDDRFLASCGELPDLAIWDLSEFAARSGSKEVLKPTDVFVDEEGWISSVAFSRTNMCLFAGGLTSRRGRSHAAELVAGKLTNRKPTPHAEWVRQIAISTNGRLMALQEDFSSGVIHVFALETNNKPRFLFSVSGHSARTVGVAFTPDNTQLITGGDDRTIRFWDVERDGELVGSLYADERIRYIGFLPTGAMVTASPDGWLRIWSSD